ncbi:hypothetical protein, partial [Burkholderia pseudomallei]
PDAGPRQRFAHVGFPQTHSPAIAAIAAMRVRPAAATRCRSCRARTKKSPADISTGGANPCQRSFMEETETIISAGLPHPNQAFLLSNCVRRARSRASGRRAYR